MTDYTGTVRNFAGQEAVPSAKDVPGKDSPENGSPEPDPSEIDILETGVPGNEAREDDGSIFEIISSEITVEVKDAVTGQVYRRELPVDYYENANFLRLTGENLDGSVSSIVFYTPRGIQRVKDITGRGADHDSCGTH